MRIFLTGGTGFIGSHLLQQALAAGHEVVALRRPHAKPRISLEQEPHWIDGDLADDWSEALTSCEAFIHLAAYGVAEGVNDWEGCFQTNVIDSLRKNLFTPDFVETFEKRRRRKKDFFFFLFSK
jgi:nucleoside-diphosphate-sugar epimerase